MKRIWNWFRGKVKAAFTKVKAYLSDEENYAVAAAISFCLFLGFWILSMAMGSWMSPEEAGLDHIISLDGAEVERVWMPHAILLAVAQGFGFAGVALFMIWGAIKLYRRIRAYRLERSYIKALEHGDYIVPREPVNAT